MSRRELFMIFLLLPIELRCPLDNAAGVIFAACSIPKLELYAFASAASRPGPIGRVERRKNAAISYAGPNKWGKWTSPSRYLRFLGGRSGSSRRD